jgi:two-component system, response regulator YesN
MQTVLVLDDDVTQLGEFEVAFRLAGFDFVPAVTGRQALALAAASSFDAIVSDLVLPDISGLDVLKTLRDRNDQTPLIVVTAFAMVDSAVAAMKIGASDFVEKPIAAADIVDIVRNALHPEDSPEHIAQQLEQSRISDRRVVGALAIIKQRYAQPELTIATVANELRVSRFFLARLFKQETGKPFSVHVHSARIHAASLLLRDGHLSIKEIAYNVGYRRPASLERWFKRLCGFTPSQFRTFR